MRGKSDFAEENVRRPAASLLQQDTIKLVSMMELARELSGQMDKSPPNLPHADPAEFWKRRFAGWHAAPPLVSTIPPARAGARKPAMHLLTLNEVASDKLRLFADRVGVSLGVLFHAAWALLLQRYSGEDDVTFGVVKGCLERESPDAEASVHIVPSRVLCESNRRVRAWLRSLADQSKATAPFEFVPLEHIRTAAEIAPGVPLFETVLSVGHDMFDPVSIATAQVHADQSQAGADTYPLVAAVYFGREIALRIAWSPSRFSEIAVQLLAGHWSTLLTKLCDCAEELVAAVPMVTAAERRKILGEWNATSAPWPSTRCVHELFEEQAARTPDIPAVMFGNETLSYRELNQRANGLANLLRARGIVPDSVVGICVERSFDMVTSVLAALKAGAAYLPLDPAYPHERLQFMLEDSRATMLLTQSSLKHVFPNAAGLPLYLDEDWTAGARLNQENPENLTTPENLSYLIYTSGSTGKPKGVAMVHRALVNLIDWQVKESHVGAGARTLQFTSLSFDVSFQEMFSTWCAGGTLVLIPAELRLAPRELWNFIAQQNIARIFLPFVALQQLAEAAALEGVTAHGLREVITAGEQLQITPRLRELFARHPEATLYNHYGPSETHVVTALALSGDPEEWPALPSIGRPIQNTQLFILDRQFEPVPVGLPGELYIGGVALARGYLERPEVTAEKFINNPFANSMSESTVADSSDSETTNARLYKTGDLARCLPDGEIEFLGRIDHQVKIRGYRVELGEIEAVLNKQPGVRECVVTAREPSPGKKQLVAYVTPYHAMELSAAALRQALKEQLPEYMVPSAFVFLAQLPLTPSGKVNRKALPAPEPAASTRAVSPAEKPWLPIQFQLVAIWEQVLGVKPIGIRDNFFELGGHSLLAVKMMDQVDAVTGRKLPVTALFHDPTIAHLADLILSEENLQAAAVIEVQTSGTRLPVYFLHGDIIGGGFYARDISRLLGNDQPFYVLPPAELIQDALPSVEEIAIHHLRDLRAHRPRGPYLLGGFCVGALVAHEMACRLRAAGEDVPFVALIDPELPGSFLRATYRFVENFARQRGLSTREKTRLFARGHKILYRLREEWNSPLRDKVRFAVRKSKRLLGRSKTTSAPASEAENKNDDSAEEQDILSVFHWIISAYQPPRSDGPLTMFLTDEQKALTPFLERQWRKVAPQVEIHRIAGDHLGAITTDVHVLTARLDEGLKRAAASKRS